MKAAEQLQAENAALREAVNNLATGKWIIGSWYETDFCWRVNERDAGEKPDGSWTYTGTQHTGRTPVDAALSALTAPQFVVGRRGGVEEEEQ